MKATESFAPWMGKRASFPTIPAGLFLRSEHFEDSIEKAQEGGWVQDELPFDEAPKTTIPEPISEESQMEKTTTIPVKHTRAYPKKSKKQTAPGTKPKRK
jgi:hypothetical protein